MKAMDDRQFDGIMKQKLEAFQDDTPWEGSEMAHVLDQVEGLYPDPSFLVKVKSLLFPGGLAVLLLGVIALSNFWSQKPEIAPVPAAPIVIEVLPIPEVVKKEPVPVINVEKPATTIITTESIKWESLSPLMKNEASGLVQVESIDLLEVAPLEIADPPTIFVSRNVKSIPAPRVDNPPIPTYCVPLYRGETLRKQKSQRTNVMNKDNMNRLQKKSFTPSRMGGSARGFGSPRTRGRRR